MTAEAPPEIHARATTEVIPVVISPPTELLSVATEPISATAEEISTSSEEMPTSTEEATEHRTMFLPPKSELQLDPRRPIISREEFGTSGYKDAALLAAVHFRKNPSDNKYNATSEALANASGGYWILDMGEDAPLDERFGVVPAGRAREPLTDSGELYRAARPGLPQSIGRTAMYRPQHLKPSSVPPRTSYRETDVDVSVVTDGEGNVALVSGDNPHGYGVFVTGNFVDMEEPTGRHAVTQQALLN